MHELKQLLKSPLRKVSTAGAVRVRPPVEIDWR